MNEKFLSENIKQTVKIPDLAPDPSAVPIEKEGLTPIIENKEIDPEDLPFEERESLEYYLNILEKKKEFLGSDDSDGYFERALFINEYSVLLLKTLQSLKDNPYDYLSFHALCGSGLPTTEEMAKRKLDFEGEYSVNIFFSLPDEDKYKFVENLRKQLGE